ncbi:MAG: endonuclease III [Sediminibacterium sp.]|nr:endonuclease III [Sediminibacterium sp.]
MTKEERYKGVLDYFQTHVPIAETELHYTNPFELLVAVILSAQCTDKRVNMVTPALFEAFPNAEALAASNSETVFSYIRSISYPNNKAKHLVGMAQLLLSDFGGTVPEAVEDLVKLPGVGRKTANVIASVVYNQPTMAVDTHVFRVSARIGLTTNAKNPLQSEKQLVAHIPEALVPRAHHWLILHGRYTCLARSPQCERCALTEWCKYFQKQYGSQIKTIPNGKEKSSKKERQGPEGQGGQSRKSGKRQSKSEGSGQKKRQTLTKKSG